MRGSGRESLAKEPSMSINGNSLPAAFAKSVRDHWVLFLVEGIVLLILGFLAIVIPPLATLAVTILLGWLFLISGIVGLFTTFWARHAPGFWWSLLSAALGIGAGVVLLAWPVGGAVSLTLVLIVFFLIEGIASIMYAMEHRQQLSGRWGWMLFRPGKFIAPVEALAAVSVPQSSNAETPFVRVDELGGQISGIA